MRRFRRTTLITVGCSSALVGLGLSRKVNLPSGQWLLIFLFCLPFLKHKNRLSLVLVILLGLGLGLWRGSLYMQKLSELKALTDQQVTVEVTSTSDAIYAAQSQLQFTANHALLIQPYRQDLAGSFKISGFGVPMVYRGDRVLVSAKLYPTRGSNQAWMSYAQLQVIGTSNSWINRLTRTFTTGMENALPEPQASFGLGLLIGQRTNLPPQIIAELTMVGLIHIVAVSGYNLTILVRGSQRLRINSKYQRTLISLSLIIGFVLVTGFSASIVRAAVVSILSLWAWYYGRDLKPLVIIAFTAAVTGLFNPFYVWGDLGWYLSFLAFFGVLIVAPLITARLARPPKLLTSVLIETLCAELMTLPLIMMSFGQLSLIGLLANLLIVPLVPWAMLFSAVAAAAGALIPELAGWIAWPANLLLTYMLDLVHLLASIPSIFLRVAIDPTLMISLYALLVTIIIIGHKKLKGQRALGELKKAS
ncbi:MAG TPA: ComEC/Rec2 family competence protein [Candidatus Binatia bacterium]|nr:ComEC/Rec2 family competence protein [Candidatus Binatia bacterium]